MDDQGAIRICRKGHPFDGQEIEIARRHGQSSMAGRDVFVRMPDGVERWFPVLWTSLGEYPAGVTRLAGTLSDYLALYRLLQVLEGKIEDIDGRGSPGSVSGASGVGGTTGQVVGDTGALPQASDKGSGTVDGSHGGERS